VEGARLGSQHRGDSVRIDGANVHPPAAFANRLVDGPTAYAEPHLIGRGTSPRPRITSAWRRPPPRPRHSDLPTGTNAKDLAPCGGRRLRNPALNTASVAEPASRTA